MNDIEPKKRARISFIALTVIRALYAIAAATNGIHCSNKAKLSLK